MAKQKVKTTIRTRVKKNGKANKGGFKQCNMCHGTGLIKKKG
jgi:hypothetical protein